jgi:hypothetical protein
MIYPDRNCELCGKKITNPSYNQRYHKEGDPENVKCYNERMHLNWQQASSNYRLRKKRNDNNNIIERMRNLISEGNLNSHGENGGRLGTGSLGAHADSDENKEKIKVKNEMVRCGLKSLL